MKKIMKNLFAFALMCAMLFAGGAAINAKAASSPYPISYYSSTYYGRVSASSKRYVYTAPYNNSKYIRTDGGLGYNWQVQILGKSSNGFYKIKYYYGSTSNTFTGWVKTSIISDISKSPDVNPKQTEKFTNIYGYTGTIYNCKSVNVHKSISFSGSNTKIITTLKKGTSVNVIAKSSSWYKVYFKYGSKKKVGYIYRKYVKVKDALKNKVYISYPTKTLSATKKYKLKVTDATKPYALSKKITWSSSNKSVATVNKKGVVKAKNAGKAKITAKVKCGNRTVYIKVKVKVISKFSLSEE